VEDVEAVLGRVVRGVLKDFAELGEEWPEDALEALWKEGAQHRLVLEEVKPRQPRREAMLEGFQPPCGDMGARERPQRAFAAVPVREPWAGGVGAAVEA
jgi:hypothetical protein